MHVYVQGYINGCTAVLFTTQKSLFNFHIMLMNVFHSSTLQNQHVFTFSEPIHVMRIRRPQKAIESKRQTASLPSHTLKR
ncbi:hypothetical protein FKM82_030621 [Ascaphus truei]